MLLDKIKFVLARVVLSPVILITWVVDTLLRWGDF